MLHKVTSLALSSSNKILLFWGMGKIADASVNSFISFFLLYYYNQVLGLHPVLASIALCIALFSDAITDPLVALYSDHAAMNNRRRTQLMAFSILPTSTCFFLLFNLNFESQLALFLQLLFFITLIRFFLTLFIVPREALGIQIFDGYLARNNLWAVNSISNIIGSSLALGPALLFFISDWGSKEGYLWASAWVAIVFTFFSHYCYLKLNQFERVKIDNLPIIEKSTLSADFVSTKFLSLFKNRPWCIMFFSCAVFSIQFGVTSGTDLYFNVHLWKLSPDDLFLGGVFSLPGSIIGALVILFFQINNKRYTAIFLGSIATVTTLILLFLGVLDVYFEVAILPVRGLGAFSVFWWLWVCQQFLDNLLWTSFWILIASMFSDTTEHHLTLTGVRLDGLILSANNFFNKSILGFGILFTGILLTTVGFEAAVTILEKEQAVIRLAIFNILVGVTLGPCALFILSYYNISKKDHENNLNQA